ncbi:M20 family metallo-hydrolase [Granulicella sp. dw_53]|uniref:M20 family metallo-hydrolase n=1 Tax=Granulicella sp. dw_53 TaxID=2719792 RepID=UPI001BD26343|nr:M20 family metallo-hydrolase [Granulicella sp. dw_53]
MQILIDEARLSSELETLATLTHVEPAANGTAVTRVVFSEDDLKARSWLKGLASKEGFSVREDAVGNTFIRWEGTEPELPAVATGSHIDAIPHAGMYDGTVGVLGGLEAMRALKRSGMKLRRSIELVLLTSEEPTRFGIGCLGSRLLSGALDPARADDLKDLTGEEGSTLATARKAAGFTGPLAATRLPAGHYHSWIELHIEQGPLLEREELRLGIVTSIAAPASYRYTIEGLGGHAGALLMPDRKDALCAAAEMILSLEKHALATGAIDTVATVGTCEVYPGAVNSVPSKVVLQIDLRDTELERREGVIRAVRWDRDEIQRRRGVTVCEELINADSPAQSAPPVVALLKEICTESATPYRTMVSRAYHDSLFMARIAPVAMIFIPCHQGVSHRPDEYAKPEDIALGAHVLAEALARLASEPGSAG